MPRVSKMHFCLEVLPCLCGVALLSVQMGASNSCLAQRRLELDFRHEIDHSVNYGDARTDLYAFNVTNKDVAKIVEVLQKLRINTISIFGEKSNRPILEDGLIEHLQKTQSIILENCIVDFGKPLDCSHVRSFDLIECAFSARVRSMKFARAVHLSVINCRLRDNSPPIEFQFVDGTCGMLSTTDGDLTNTVFETGRANIGTLRIASDGGEFAASTLTKLISTVQHLRLANFKVSNVRLSDLSFVKQSIVFERCGVGTDTVFANGEVGFELTSPQLRFEKCIVVGESRPRSELEKRNE